MKTRITLLIAGLAFVCSSPLLAQSAQNAGTLPGSDVPVIVVQVWAPAVSDQNTDSPAERQLSREFSVAALNAMSALRGWQHNLTVTIRNGYPLAEQWVVVERDLADDRLRLAAMAARNRADLEVLEDLARQYSALRAWSDQLIDASHTLSLAAYYMSPSALEDDPVYRQSRACSQFLASVLESGQLAESTACR
jgi:hypothetical protein